MNSINEHAGWLSDRKSLRSQLVGGAFCVSLVFAALWLVVVWRLDAQRQAEVQVAEARALAGSAAVWCDGDAHGGSGADLGTRLEEVGSLLGKMAESNGLDTPPRTLRLKPTFTNPVAADPGKRFARAFEVVVQGAVAEEQGASGAQQADPEEVDYDPDLEAALFSGEVVTKVRGQGPLPGRVLAYAPIENAWGEVVGLLEVQAPQRYSIFKTLLRLFVAAVAATVVVVAFMKLVMLRVDRLCRNLEALSHEAECLAYGEWSPPLEVKRSAREIEALGEALSTLRESLERDADGVSPLTRPEPVPVERPAAPAPAPQTKQQSTQERVTYPEEPVLLEVPLFVQQVADSARAAAQHRSVTLRTMLGEHVPPRIYAQPTGISNAIKALLKNALLRTEGGSVTVRVSKVPDALGAPRLRFEIADTGRGISYKEQPVVTRALEEAATKAPGDLKDPCLRAAALAHQLGGAIGFESQPGSGSRFWFTTRYEPDGVQPAGQLADHTSGSIAG